MGSAEQAPQDGGEEEHGGQSAQQTGSACPVEAMKAFTRALAAVRR